jgi:hypothetical protein
MKDIVDWLRSVLHNDRSVELHCRQAADEIERLRAELDEIKREVDRMYDDKFSSNTGLWNNHE